MSVTGAPLVNQPFASEEDHLEHHRALEECVDGATGATGPTGPEGAALAVTDTTIAAFGASGIDAAGRPAVPTQVAAVDVDDFNLIRDAMIALGIWADGD